MNDDVATSQWAASRIEAIDSDRKEIGTIVHIYSETTQPTVHPDLPTKVGVITWNRDPREFPIGNANASARIVVHKVPLGKS